MQLQGRHIYINLNRTPCDGSQKTEKRHGQIRWVFVFTHSLITASCGGSGRRLTQVDFFGFFFLGDNENWRESQSLEEGARKDRGRAACREDVSGIAKDQRAAEDGE